MLLSNQLVEKILPHIRSASSAIEARNQLYLRLIYRLCGEISAEVVRSESERTRIIGPLVTV